MSTDTFNKNKHSWSEIKDMLNSENDFLANYSIGDILYLNLKDPTETVRCQITDFTQNKTNSLIKGIYGTNTVILSMIDTLWCLPFDGYEGSFMRSNLWEISDLFSWLNASNPDMMPSDKNSPFYGIPLFKEQIDPEFVKIIGEVSIPTIIDKTRCENTRYSVTGSPVNYWVNPRVVHWVNHGVGFAKTPLAPEESYVYTRKNKIEKVDVGLDRYVCPTFKIMGSYGRRLEPKREFLWDEDQHRHLVERNEKI